MSVAGSGGYDSRRRRQEAEEEEEELTSGSRRMLLGVRRSRETKVRDKNRVFEPPSVQDATGRSRIGVRLQQSRPNHASV